MINWVGDCRGRDEEGTGIQGGLKLCISMIRGEDNGGVGSSAIVEGWFKVAGCFKVDICWVGNGSG